ncbi:papilin isoform X3 [Lutzomyia longipalpis]|uniref:papilin isoform X3 n=1 Tax=Lutzomyia longipalpis TaxID=7200 RepID=UPI002483E348|nr:papilin isoform X3 [Lutzomyia longipalpis]
MGPSRQLQIFALLLCFFTTSIDVTQSRHLTRNRHKRQHGARLYLPATYVIPSGEGDSGERWGPWGAPSECTRTCGGGVAYQTRECYDVAHDGTPRCRGGSRKYFSCNTQDCPDNEPDFRAQQCSHFDTVPFEGVRYEWVPYTKAPNPCELNCMPRGERFYYRHKAKVIDGTRCNEESLDVCVDGTCQPVGCDMMLGSNAKEDKCRKCEGDGSSCKTVSGILDMNNLQVGYNDILLIPAGATNIEIKEVAPSNNYLAIRNLVGAYYLNGNWRIDFPRPMTYAGGIWHYERKPQGFAAPDHLTCMGPTTEPIYLVLLYQDRNVGIRYEYSVPEATARVPQHETYNWVFGPYSECSATCGGGFQTRNVTCNSRTTLEQVDDSLCDTTERMEDARQCGQEPCPPRWTEGPWSKCSLPCGEEGKQEREVTCERVDSSGVATKVEDSVCLNSAGNKPATVQECNKGVVCPQWHTGPWKPCSHLCGDGEKKRQVRCYRKEDGKIKVLSDDECIDEKPAETETCMLRPCDGVDWITSTWSGCNACGLTVETRTAHCASKAGKIYDEKFCEKKPKPELERPCTSKSQCDFQWFTSQWSKCSAACGKGVQTRTIICGVFDGEMVKRAPDESSCNADEKPEDQQECESENECPGQWFGGPWSECSVPCGGGTKLRKTLCMVGDQPAPVEKCSGDTVEFSSESCNPDACIDDETLPVDSTSTPILEDDHDEEEYCDEDEDYPVSGEELDSGEVTGLEETSGTLSFFESESKSTTESSLLTDELMLSDSTGFETDETDAASTDLPESTVEGSGTQETASSLHVETDETGSGDFDGTQETTETSEVSSASVTVSSLGVSQESSAAQTTVDVTETTTEGVTTTSESVTTTSESVTETSTESSSEFTTESSTETSESTSESSVDTTTEISTTESLAETTTVAAEESTTSQVEETTTSEGGTTTEGATATTEAQESTTVAETQSTVEGSDGTTASEESASQESTTEGSTESPVSTETPGSTESPASTVTEETSSTGEDETTESDMDIWTTTEQSGVSQDEDEETSGSTPNTLEEIIKKEQKPRKCKPRPKTMACTTSTFGCCSDEKTPAKGPFEEGCPTPKTCTETKHGCCPDGLSPAKGPKNRGCPKSVCKDTLFGCCPDKKTPAEGNDNEGCPVVEVTTVGGCAATKHGCCPDGITAAEGPKHKGCKKEDTECTGETCTTPEPKVTEESSVTDAKFCAQSTYGCCPDGISEATGENFHGCDIIDEADCTKSFYGCCPDGRTPAKGDNHEGCTACMQEPFGCCQDGQTPAHGPRGEGCCLEQPFGCCPDNIVPARGPNLEGCGCEHSPYGCCPDNKTSAKGYDNAGCGCQYSRFGCCPDKLTEARGENFEGCSCHTFQFGCCPDGVTIPTGPHNSGCHCSQTEHKCCGDEITPAKGPNFEGCTCATSKHGCCPDGVTPAEGRNFEGCDEIPSNPQKACGLPRDAGSCKNFTVKSFFDAEYGGCSRFWYGGCEGNDNRFNSIEECKTVCEEPIGKEACSLPKSHGPCTGYLPMWYYDSDRNQCTQFVWGGCLGNNNRFESLEECQTACVVDDSAPPCEQPVDNGPCNGEYERWYFDAEADICRPFIYGGCKGNKNNYASEHACHYHCKKPGVHREFCNSPIEKGNCENKQARWGFSYTDNKCMPFYYTGCGGNKNNYRSEDECTTNCPPQIERDLCVLPAEVGNCQNYTTRWYFDTRQSRCRSFYYGGCGGNKNNFEQEEDCLNRCERRPTTTPQPVRRPQVHDDRTFRQEYCFIQPDAGDCRGDAIVARWYYNREEGVCAQFAYTGCGGNQNNFETEEDCERNCDNVQDICTLPALRGRCNERIQRWYFDQNTQRCQQFEFGGCRGNKNNFYTERECQSACRHEPGRVEYTTPPARAPVSICEEPRDYGNCNGNELKYFFNRDTASCEAFYYTGCGGNGNRFESQEQCERQCGEHRGVDVCNEPKDQGPCDQWQTRYYFDSTRRQCLPFHYGGCGGTGNKFTTPQECESLCIGHEEPPPDDKGEQPQQPEREPSGDKCEEHTIACENLQCPYGVETKYNEDYCPVCSCEDPCSTVQCQPDSLCAIDVDRDETGQPIFLGVCRKTNKPGECPTLSDNQRCDRECYTDADCRGEKKCCSAGCGWLCLHPESPSANVSEPSRPYPYPTSYYPGSHAPVLEEKTPEEVNVAAEEGGFAVLHCFATGYPPPTITWRRHDIILNTNQGRYLLTSTGDLQIVQLHRTDDGTYVCVADNGLGTPVTREVELRINDPVNIRDADAYILGEPNSTQIVTLNQPATLRCLAGGYPKPYVSWWRDTELLPLNSSRFEQKRDNSLAFTKVDLTDLGKYTCQAYTGRGKPVSVFTTLLAVGPVHVSNEEDEKYLQYVIDPPVQTTTIRTRPEYPYRPAPPPPPRVIPLPHVQPVVPSNTPVTARLRLPGGRQYALGADIKLECVADGYPTPNITWSKDNRQLVPSHRLQIIDQNRVVIYGASREDSGFYKCEAWNGHSKSFQEEEIMVEGVFIPPECTDSQQFADCSKIVRGSYCNNPYYAKFCCRSCTLAGQLSHDRPNFV